MRNMLFILTMLLVIAIATTTGTSARSENRTSTLEQAKEKTVLPFLLDRVRDYYALINRNLARDITDLRFDKDNSARRNGAAKARVAQQEEWLNSDVHIACASLNADAIHISGATLSGPLSRRTNSERSTD